MQILSWPLLQPFIPLAVFLSDLLPNLLVPACSLHDFMSACPTDSACRMQHFDATCGCMLVSVDVCGMVCAFARLARPADLHFYNILTWLDEVNEDPSRDRHSEACGLPLVFSQYNCGKTLTVWFCLPAAPARCCSHFVQLQWTVQWQGIDHIPQRRDGQTGCSRALQPHFLRPAGPFGFL